jgi:hypothetical protein
MGPCERATNLPVSSLLDERSLAFQQKKNLFRQAGLYGNLYHQNIPTRFAMHIRCASENVNQPL